MYNYSQAKKDADKKPETIKEEDASTKIKPTETTSSSSPARRCPGIASKAAVFENSPNKMKDPALLSVAERKALFEKNKGEVVMPKPAFIANKKPPAPKPPVVAAAAKPIIETGNGIASKMAALLENKTTISQAQIESGVKQQRQKEMDALLNRFNKNKEAKEDSDDDGETTPMIKEEKTVKILSPPPLPPVGPQTSAAKRSSEFSFAGVLN